MMHLETAQLNLSDNGWALLVNEKETLGAQIGDLVKIKIEIVSPLDFDAEEIRSVSHEALWVEITEIAEDFTSLIKTGPSHDFSIKDGTKLAIGDKISFGVKNIFAVR